VSPDMDLPESDRAGSRSDRVRVVLVGILVLLLLLLVTLAFFVVRVLTPAGAPSGAGATAAGLTWVRSIYGYGPSQAEQLFRPVDAAVSPDGKIWGSDKQRDRVLGFNTDGSFAAAIMRGAVDKKSDPKLWQPGGVAVAEDGTVYVVDSRNEKVEVFTSQSQFLREWSVPMPIELDVRNGRVVVTSIPGVSVYTTDGKLLSVWGRQGIGADEFDTPSGVAIAADGTVYVSDSLNSRVKAYKPDGTLKWIWPKERTEATRTGITPAPGSVKLQLPTGLTIDGAGRIVVLDAFSFDLVVLKPSATYADLVARYGEFGTQDGRFIYPSGIDYDPARDWFVVADTNNDRLQIVRLPGSATPGAVAAAARAAAAIPPWCAVPMGALVLLAVVLILRRRTRLRTVMVGRSADEPQEDVG
jgi:sugar lactone lactonase YvrE